jgi:hypothetical protein
MSELTEWRRFVHRWPDMSYPIAMMDGMDRAFGTADKIRNIQ